MSSAHDLAVTASPLYQHDCSRCVYLGPYKDHANDSVDLYVCATLTGRSVIARYSSSGPDYQSGTCFSYGSNDALTEARLRAQARGILEFDTYEALDYAKAGTPSFEELLQHVPSTKEHQAWQAYQTGKEFDSHGLIMQLVQLERAKPYLKDRTDSAHLDAVESRIRKVIAATTGCLDREVFNKASEVTGFFWDCIDENGKLILVDLSVPEIQEARQFALKWHAGQMWGDQPYIEHLDEVAELFASKGAEVWQIVAAYLHDIIEDPKCPEDEILAKFGQLVFDWVYAVSGFGANRKEKQQNIVDKLRRNKTGAARLKLGDRLINVRKCVRDGNLSMLKMYRKEAELYGELFAAADAKWAAELNRLLQV